MGGHLPRATGTRLHLTLELPPTMSIAKNQKNAAKAGPGRVENKKVAPTKPDEMSDELIEFITAIDEYKRLHQRPFPSWSEVLDILKELGYERQP